MGRLISQQAAIDALKICDANYDGTNCDKCPLRDDRWDGAWWDDEIDCHTKLMRDTAKLLETLSAQPERKTGHWILDRSGAYCCDRCMEPCASYVMMKPRDKFCKMCGSRNEVTE